MAAPHGGAIPAISLLLASEQRQMGEVIEAYAHSEILSLEDLAAGRAGQSNYPSFLPTQCGSIRA